MRRLFLVGTCVSLIVASGGCIFKSNPSAEGRDSSAPIDVTDDTKTLRDSDRGMDFGLTDTSEGDTFDQDSDGMGHGDTEPSDADTGEDTFAATWRDTGQSSDGGDEEEGACCVAGVCNRAAKTFCKNNGGTFYSGDDCSSVTCQ